MIDLGSVVNTVLKNVIRIWELDPTEGAGITGLLIGFSLVGLLVFIFLAQRGIEWTADWKYDEFCVKKKFCPGDDSFERGFNLGVLFLGLCLSPIVILIVYRIWPILLIGSIALGFAHTMRFVLRLFRRFNLHEKDYKMHNGGGDEDI